MSQVHPLRIDEDILKIIEIKSEDENTNKTTAIKQLLYAGAEEYVLKMCEEGRISLGKASLVLHKSVYELQRAAKQKGIRLGLTAKEYEYSKKLADKLSS